MSKRIFVIGGGRRAGSLLRFLSASHDYEVAGVYKIHPDVSIVDEARAGISEILVDWREFLKSGKCDAVLDLSGDDDMASALRREAEPLGVEVIGQVTANLLWQLLEQAWARDVFDKLQSKIESSWSLEEILILLLEASRKLTSSSSGLIFLRSEKEITDKVSWDVSGSDCDEAIACIKDFSKFAENFYAKHRPSYYIPLFESSVAFGGLLLFSAKSEFIDDALINLIQTKVSSIITQSRSIRQTIKLSNVDGLTGLFNHRYFHEELEKEIYRAQQYDLNFSLMILDIDFFKKFNDTHGHLAGDRHLKAIAKILRFILRETDFIARYGGEEFAVILPEAGIKGALIAAERIRKEVEKQDFGRNMRSTVSIGVSAYPDHGVGKNDIIEKADRALYKAKETGRNKVCAAELNA